MRRAVRWPRFLVGAEEPDGIGREARGLGGAGNQNRRVLRFGREERFVQGAIESREEFFPLHAPAIETERRAVVEGLLPAAVSLEFRARKRTVPRANRQVRAAVAPVRPRRAEIAGGVRIPARRRWACVTRASHAAGNSTPGLWRRNSASVQRVRCRFLRRSARMKAVRASDSPGEAARWPVERSQSSSCSSIGSVSQCRSRPAPARERDLAEWNAQRELKDAGRSRRASAFANETEKRALDLAAAFGHILCNNEQARVRIGGELVFAPERAGGKFGDGIGGLVEFDLRGGFARVKPACKRPRQRRVSVAWAKCDRSRRAAAEGARRNPVSALQSDSSGRRAALMRLPARQISSNSVSQSLKAAASWSQPPRVFPFSSCGA